MTQTSRRAAPPTNQPLPDHLAGGLRLLFVGINPGLRSAALGHHYAGPSNRFWKLLADAALVPERLSYRDDARLPQWGLGLTNFVARPTAGSADLTAEDFEQGRLILRRKIRRYRPRVIALLGLTLYPYLFPHEPARTTRAPGLQPITLYNTPVILLPNPSGRNAAYPYPAMLQLFRALTPLVAETDAEASGDARPSTYSPI